MICRAYVKDESLKQAVILPSQVIQLDKGNRYFVWLNIDGIAQKQMIQIGNITEQGVIITSGLKPGDQVIVRGQQKISSGQKISAE